MHKHWACGLQCIITYGRSAIVGDDILQRANEAFYNDEQSVFKSEQLFKTITTILRLLVAWITYADDHATRSYYDHRGERWPNSHSIYNEPSSFRAFVTTFATFFVQVVRYYLNHNSCTYWVRLAACFLNKKRPKEYMHKLLFFPFFFIFYFWVMQNSKPGPHIKLYQN